MTQYVYRETRTDLQYAKGDWINAAGMSSIEMYQGGFISVTEFVLQMAGEGYHIQSVSDDKIVVLVDVCDGRVTLAVEVEKCKAI
ncbi:hypothetical protein PQC38_gp005 [Aeromonas phage BUCT695]|uniref:hypothetical protein n=1 Tax=Aeromonas phage BUCT695 TaxID=2908630 RepID=UPI0023298016|nr:hypothetical protein PQC38_gp005 [Aeromonas phage BUCT695]UIW10481.1 hypothetical protein [Aeromonas phage BUCT695]